MKKQIYVTIILALSNFPALFAQQQSLYQQMSQAFQLLDYQMAEKIGKQITADYESHTLLEILEAHKILGVIAYQDGNLTEANAEFNKALSIDRTTQLDSVIVSPKIIQFFKDIKSKYVSKPVSGEIDKTMAFRYLIEPDPRPAATMRSIILPGWGQLYKNEKTKGYALVASSVIMVLSSGVFHWLQKNAHNDYLKATEPDIIEKNYDRYNQLYKLRNNTVLLTSGIWLYSFFDALIVKSKSKQLNISVNVNEYHYVVVQLLF